MDTMLTYNTNSKTGPVCGGRASIPAFGGAYVVDYILNEAGTEMTTNIIAIVGSTADNAIEQCQYSTYTKSN